MSCWRHDTLLVISDELVQHQQPAAVPEVSEEDEIQKAIALSLEGGAGLGVRGASSGGAEAGWGGRLAEQERAEEQRYKEEAEKAVREEVIWSRIKFSDLFQIRY